MSTSSPQTLLSRTRHFRPMRGRDPHEAGRVATTLELLFDLVFVVAISQAATQFAHVVAEGHYVRGIGAFCFAIFAVLWAWINFSWFSSAFDTDDWVYRLTTMVQMVGVTILGIGLPPLFHSIDSGHGLDNRVVVAGYVVMRVAMVFQWLRAAHQCPERRTVCMAYVWSILIAQIGWVITAFLYFPPAVGIPVFATLYLIEVGGPYVAETRHGGTPWHAHHIAERYGLLAIIALGEGIVGTVSSLSAVVESQGWSIDAVLVVTAGMGLTFGMWWSYFLLPAGELLHVHRDRSFRWGYGSLPVLAAIAATGAGLDVAALYIGHKAQIGPVATVLALDIPVAMFLVGIYWLYAVLYDEVDRYHQFLGTLTAVVVIAAPLLAWIGMSMAVCLLVVMVAPLISVVGYEAHGYRHVSEALAKALET